MSATKITYKKVLAGKITTAADKPNVKFKISNINGLVVPDLP
jgi:hypothetical protein